MLLSCKNEEGIFYSLEFDTEGIELIHNYKNGTFDGTVPANGSVFYLTGKGDFLQYAYVTTIKINGIPVKAEGLTGEFPRPQYGSPLIINGEWGKVEYLTDSPPYIIEFIINPNNEDTTRSIEIKLGYGYWCSYINLCQSAYFD